MVRLTANATRWVMRAAADVGEQFHNTIKSSRYSSELHVGRRKAPEDNTSELTKKARWHLVVDPAMMAAVSQRMLVPAPQSLR